MSYRGSMTYPAKRWTMADVEKRAPNLPVSLGATLADRARAMADKLGRSRDPSNHVLGELYARWADENSTHGNNKGDQP